MYGGCIPEVSIIVPARNEEGNLAGCLESLNAQAGVAFEIIVVDDSSTDRTREIAQSFGGVRVLSPPPIPQGWTGKNNALVAGAEAARSHSHWLLFTDADTVHLPGSLARALEEAKKDQADLLSYSPEQVVVTFAERAVMPVVFAELAAQYPPRKVREQNSGVVAANGQYILVRRSAYDATGGHTAVATEILEDVALARRFRNAGYRVHFRYGGDAVRTRMYRNWPQLREGWIKNLALLFPRTRFLALRILLSWSIAWSSIAGAAGAAYSWSWTSTWIAIGIVATVLWILMYRRIRAAHFSTTNSLLAVTFGVPMFAYLLVRSNAAHARGKVSWKGRQYSVSTPSKNTSAKAQGVQPISSRDNQQLRTEN